MLSKIGREYKVHAGFRIKQAAVKAYGRVDLSEMAHSPLRLEIDVCRPSWKCKTKGKTDQFVKRDLDNFTKAVCDALMETIKLDDSQIVELYMRKVDWVGEAESTVLRLIFL